MEINYETDNLEDIEEKEEMVKRAVDEAEEKEPNEFKSLKEIIKK